MKTPKHLVYTLVLVFWCLLESADAATLRGTLEINDEGKVTLTTEKGEVLVVKELPNGDLQFPPPTPPNKKADGSAQLRYYFTAKNGVTIQSWDLFDDDQRLASWVVKIPVTGKEPVHPLSRGGSEMMRERVKDVFQLELQYYLASNYYDGLISDDGSRESRLYDHKDAGEAFKWMLRLAKLGYAEAYFYAGQSFEMGWGTTKNPALAAKWFKASADQGQLLGLLGIAEAFRLGKGVPKDQIEAYAYLNIAGAKNEGCRDLANRLEKTLPPEARLLGQQRARQLQSEIEERKSKEEEARRLANEDLWRRGA